MPTKERAARQRQRQDQQAQQAQQAQRGAPGGLPRQLQTLLDSLRAAGVEVAVAVERVEPAAMSQALGASLRGCGLQAAGAAVGHALAATPGPREIQAELDLLHGALTQLNSTYDQLDARLVAVSTPALAGPDEAASGSSPALSDIAHQIREARFRVDRLAAAVGERLDRLGI